MIDKVSVICPNIGIVYSGMGPDFRVLVTRARKSAQAYWKVSISIVADAHAATYALHRSMASTLRRASSPKNWPRSYNRRRSLGVYSREYLETRLLTAALQWCSSVWCITPRRWLGLASRPTTVPG